MDKSEKVTASPKMSGRFWSSRIPESPHENPYAKNQDLYLWSLWQPAAGLADIAAAAANRRDLSR
jgi:hypothetical protein